MMNLFEDDFKKVKLFEDSVKMFKQASRDLQYTYNLKRSKVFFHNGSFGEELSPLFSLIEEFKATADHLYHLKNISPLRPLKRAIEKFKETYIDSVIKDDEIRDIYTDEELIKRMFKLMRRKIELSIQLFEASGMKGQGYLDGLKGILETLDTKYAVSA